MLALAAADTWSSTQHQQVKRVRSRQPQRCRAVQCVCLQQQAPDRFMDNKSIAVF